MDLIAVPCGEGLVIDGSLVAWPDAAGVVAAREAAEQPRWVWPDTASLYPRLLDAGVRVQRAHDLRLCHAILRSALPGPHPAPAWLTPEPEAPVAPPSLLDEWDAPEPRDPAGLAGEVAAEHARQLAAVEAAPGSAHLRLLLAAESAGALIAAEMNADGLPWSRERHDALLAEALGPRPPEGRRPDRLERLAERIRDLLAEPGLNPDSPVALLRALQQAGLDVRSTSKWEIGKREHPVVAPLLEYKALARLLSANGWHWLDTWVRPGRDGRAGRFRTDYVPGGVVTGRWATRGAGAMQIPKTIRGAVVADPGWRLVVADAAQIEPRCMAAMARDELLAAAGRDGDLYTGLVEARVVETRDRAKVAMLSAMYGGTAGEAGRLMPRLRDAYPRAIALVEDAARTGERGGVVRTWLGRTSPVLAQIPPRERALARDRGRFTRNFVVQGTAAEWALCWMADLRRRLRTLGDPDPSAPGEGRPHLVFFLHDEVVVHTPAQLAADVEAAIRAAADAAGRLLFGDFPITFPLDVATVDSYDEAG